MAKSIASERKRWIQWMKSYPPGEFFDHFMQLCQWAESVCVHCKQKIYLDIVEGGGVPDWGSSFGDVPHLGLDYGCPDSPDSDDEGTGGHEPRKLPTRPR